MGVVGKYFFAALKQSPNFKIVAICDKKNDISETSCSFYRSYQELCADEVVMKSVDAAIICLPNHLHVLCAQDFLSKGKHVLCEKPLCFTIADAAMLQVLANERHLTLMTAFHRRYNFHFKKFHEAIDEPIKVIHARYLENIKQHSDSDWYLYNAKSGGGCVIDNGSNVFDLIRLLVGEISIERAYMGGYAGENESHAYIDFSFKTGRGTIELDWNFDGECKDISVYTANKSHHADLIAETKHDIRTVNFKGSLWHEYEDCIRDFYEHVIGKISFDNEDVVRCVNQCYTEAKQN